MKTGFLVTLGLFLGALALSAQPVIVTPPRHTTNLVGTTASFSVIATSDLPIIYQWRMGGSTLSPLEGETNTTLVLPNVQQNGRVDVIVSDMTGSVTSTIARLTVRTPPRIVIPPSSQTVTQGTRVVLSVQARSCRNAVSRRRHHINLEHRHRPNLSC